MTKKKADNNAKKSSGGGDKGGDKKQGAAKKGSGTCKEVKARHILCEKMGRMEEVMTKLKEGWLDEGKQVPASEFAKLATQYSECSSKNKGGDLGWFGRGKMVGAFQDAAFNASVGEITSCKSPHGYHVILVEGKRN